jgi:hypothetical protein
MSEYQCYEFLALDRPLSNKEVAELRAISTRAQISPTRFWNEYHWGDLKADPAKLMARHFDAHLYFANWGTRRFMLRLPKGSIDSKTLAPYFPRGRASRLTRAGNYVLLDCTSDEEEYELAESSGSLAALSQLRAELMRGDLRAAYLAWLLSVQSGEVDDDGAEPTRPSWSEEADGGPGSDGRVPAHRHGPRCCSRQRQRVGQRGSRTAPSLDRGAERQGERRMVEACGRGTRPSARSRAHARLPVDGEA